MDGSEAAPIPTFDTVLTSLKLRDDLKMVIIALIWVYHKANPSPGTSSCPPIPSPVTSGYFPSRLF